jgi:hypothetical protein
MEPDGVGDGVLLPENNAWNCWAGRFFGFGWLPPKRIDCAHRSQSIFPSPNCTCYVDIDFAAIAAVFPVLQTTEYTHRVAIADFCRTSHHDGKISPGWWEWSGARPPPPL